MYKQKDTKFINYYAIYISVHASTQVNAFS